jgi:HK97 family phage portal protein
MPMGPLEWLNLWYSGPPKAAAPDRKAVNISNYAPPPMYGYAGRTSVGPVMHSGMYLTDQRGQQSSADNSAVFACLQTLTRAYVEPPLRVYTFDGDAPVPVDGHPLAALLRRPNPFMPGKPFLRYTEWCKHTYGNAYWRKIRAGTSGSGNVVELWPISPSKMAPVTYKGSGDFISAYRYTIDGGKYEDIPVSDIVHFRMGIDDDDQRVGCSGLQRLLREVASDTEATLFADRLLRNNAVPGLVVVPPKDATMDEQRAQEVKARIESAYGGENTGRVGVVSPGSDLKMLGFDPQSMDLSTLHRIPEERISAVLGVPAVLAGLGAGLQNATYSNVRELREFFTESTLVPLWAEDGETITHQLLPDFSADPTMYVAFDTDDVRALQQDESDLYTRLSAAVVAGWLLPADARDEAGYDPAPQLDAPAATPPPPVAPGAARGLYAVETKAGGQDDFVALLATARAEAEARTQAALVREFASLKRRAIHRAGAG